MYFNIVVIQLQKTQKKKKKYEKYPAEIELHIDNKDYNSFRQINTLTIASKLQHPNLNDVEV